MTFKGRLLMPHFVVRRVAAILPMSQKTSLTQNTRFCPTNCSRPTPATDEVDRLSAGGLDRLQPIGEHRGQDIDHLPIECAAAPGVAGGSVANPNQARSEILRLWTAEFAKGQDLDPGDKAYVAQVVAARTSLSQVDAEKRVNEIGKGLQLVIA